MTLRLHDTAARTVREFHPLTPGRASVYLCGATVQATPHLGHLRSAVCFDVLVRWLEASGYQVTYCRNVTDIDDKILRVAAADGIPWWALAERNLRAFTEAYDMLGCRPPDVQPRATGHIPEMIELIGRLIEGGHAYRAGREIQAGRVWTNCYHAYPAHAAFGGYKQSGVGRENHKMMLDHYQQTKNLLVSYSPKKLGFF